MGEYPRQDAEYGRDATHNDPSDGHAGFSFTKIGADGAPLAIQNGTWNDAGSEEQGTKWSCVRDNVTGLGWETKTNDGGIHDRDNTYSWYNPDDNTNGGSAGVPHGGVCIGSACDTYGVVQAVNQQTLCGASDWRLPTPQELLFIVTNDRADPAIDTAYFPNMHSAPVSRFWSLSSYPYNAIHAWMVDFTVGKTNYFDKGTKFSVRLVHGGQ
jgi:hypothetical protein